MTLILPASLRAIEARKHPPVVWEDNLPGVADRNAVIGASFAEIVLGGIDFSAIAEPLRVSPGYVWTLVGPGSDEILDYGLADDLADAKRDAEETAERLASEILAD